MKISRKTWQQITSTTLIQTVLNTGFRMVFPFQPVLMKGFNINLAQITRMYAGQSLIGILSPLLASISDTRGRRTGMLAGLVLFSFGVFLVVIFPTPMGFFIFLVLSMMAKAIFDPSMLAYYGDIIPYQRRGFVFGIIEISWSMSFFFGMPLVGYLLSRFGLLAPFILLALLVMLAIVVILFLIPADPKARDHDQSPLANIAQVFRSGTAIAGLGVTLLICTANQLINVVFGVWLNQSFGMQIAALGGASIVIGIAELIGEGGVSALADRISIKRAVLLGTIGNILACGLLPILGRTNWGAYLGLFLFYLTFEITLVSLIPLMAGILPAARGTVLALNIASANLGRGLGSLIAAPLFLGGFWISAFGAAIVNLLAIIVLRYVVVPKDH